MGPVERGWRGSVAVLTGVVLVLAAFVLPPRGAGAGRPDAALAAGAATLALPAIDNRSGAPDAHVQALVQEAVDGLGFAGDGEGPQPQDRVFVGRHYIVWIDETGFYGKANGLWWLNGDVANLDFSVRDKGVPLNEFIVGERHDGGWPDGYEGAEHTEFPNAETEEDGPCLKEYCSAYGVDEAAQKTRKIIPWWTACSTPGSLTFDEHIAPMSVQVTATGLRLWYQAPLRKVADLDGVYDGDGCHQDFMFPDGVRRRVHLDLGYELYADQPYLDRLTQVENPAGNPPFSGPYGVVGGFVLTRYPIQHPLKKLANYFMPEDHDVPSPDGSTLAVGQWNVIPPAGQADVVVSWLHQAYYVSPWPQKVTGLTARISQIGPDPDDTGICLCLYHGAVETAGGQLHPGISLPVAGGASTPVSRRRLQMSGDGWLDPAPFLQQLQPTTTTTSTTTTSTTAPAPTTSSTTGTPVPSAASAAADPAEPVTMPAAQPVTAAPSLTA